MLNKAFSFILAFILFSFSIFGQVLKKRPINNGIDRPKLVIGLVVDQMRWDYLYRYYNLYSEGGFKRLLKKGHSFENAMIPFVPSLTAAGHTGLYTGSVPALHGIVGNNWSEQGGAANMYCTSDNSVRGVGSNFITGQMSPRNLLTTTIGDELRLGSNFKSRVFGLALKDRGGILAAGHSANAAYWFDDSTANWITSSYYMQQLPKWVQDFNGEKKADALMAKEEGLLYDESVYDQSDRDTAYHRVNVLDTKQIFPHLYSTKGGKNYSAFRLLPSGNTFTLDFATQLIENEKLGRSGQTDMFCISLSSTDYLAHRFGPQARETEDCYLRLDKDLETFFSMLDKRIGKGAWTLFLSADHGAMQTPAHLKEKKLPTGVLNGFDMYRELNEKLFAKYNVNKLLKVYYEYQFYFDKEKLDSAGIDLNEAENYALDILKKKPEVLFAFSYRNFEKLVAPAFLKERLQNGYYAKRSGDFQMILRSNYTETQWKGTDHGTIYPYDLHIPLLWYGWGIKPGKTFREVYMTDVAPTIAAMLRIQMPSGSVGKVLEEVFRN